jgi:uncharacterized protein YwgA
MPEGDDWSRKAMIAELSEQLLAHGSWCGETHIQKCVYFLEDLFEVPVGYDFVLYKHGPYSFSLHDELIEMKVRGMLVAEPQGQYGPTLRPGTVGRLLLERQGRAGAASSEQIAFVAERFGNAAAADLERVATALFITRRRKTPKEQRAAVLTQLKPHIAPSDAKAAVADADKLLADAAGQRA